MTGLFSDKRPDQQDTGTRRRVSWWLEALLLLVATASLGWVGYNFVAAEGGQLWSNYALDTEMDGRQPSLTGFVRHLFGAERHEAERSPAEAEVAETPKAEPPVRLPRGADIGRIEIPRLKIASIVRQGVDDKTLSRSVGHVPYTSMPGQSGNVGLAAHRDTYFRNLRDVRQGDVIRLVTPRGTFEYKVDSLDIVTPKNVEVLDPTPQPALTLVTCYPFNFVGHAPKRFIVRAKQINPPPAVGKRRT